jgi:hypothetical protein
MLAEYWDVIQDEATKESSKAACRCLVIRFRGK